MGAFWQNDRFLTRALIASLVLHLVFAYLIPSLTTFSASGPTVETISFVRMIRLSVQKHEEPKHIRAATAPALAKSPSNEKHSASAGPHSTLKTVAQSKPNGAPIVAAQSVTGDVNAQATVSATATPAQQTDIAAANKTRLVGGNMPFGEEQNPVLDSGIHQQLTALGVHVTLTITVDESGHTKNVSFAPPLSNDVEDHIRAMLSSAAWDPAICGGGIACEGKATITL